MNAINRRRPPLPRGCATVLLLGLLATSGCGYHFHGENPQLPADIVSIAVGHFDNRTRDHGLEKSLAFAFEREIHLRRHYRLEQNVNVADAVLGGAIRRLDRRPVAFDQNDQAVTYEISLVIDLTLSRRDNGRPIWRTRSMRKTEEYSASPRVVVTSSSQFQRGTLNPEDLPRVDDDGIPDNEQISSIQLAESERQRAIDRLFSSVVRDSYDSMVEGF